jgi:ABC-type Fe3+-hydroxamate transport system substrate-binding protein
MKRIYSTLTVLLLAVTVAPAQISIDRLSATSGRTVQPDITVAGYLMDAQCASTNMRRLVTAASEHTTACAVGCPTQEYGLVMDDGMWVPFDEKSSKKVAKLLAKTTTPKGLRVTAKGQANPKAFSVSSLKEVKPDD